MNLSYEWLKELVSIKESPEKIAERLTYSGLEVESVESRKNFSKVIIGEVLEVGPHPNADRLHLTKVNTGKEVLSIVCGANNLSVGIKVPVACVGAVIEGFEIKKADLRGVESNGMICSERELGLGEDHSGILILPDGAPIGKNLEDYLDFDAIIDIAIPANRPDCMSVIGLAREVSTIIGETYHLPKINIKESAEKTEDVADVEVQDGDLCPRYIARVVRGLTIKPSPEWLQKRLTASGVRPINNLVDISNYVMLEYGQPLHFFDMAKLAKENHKAKIIVRKARNKETITTLDGVKRELDPDTLVIADPKGAVAIAGIMGGENSEVDEKTSDLLIEAAVFDKAQIRKAARNLGLRSEAVARFEKGLPLNLPEVAADRACELLADLAGGQILAGRVDRLDHWIWIQHIGLRMSKLKKMLGLAVSEHQVVDILERLGFEAKEFDVVEEAKKHLGKPYLFGANFKEHRTSAFDCSYLTDYIYSRIGLMIGHTSLGQLHHGWEVKANELVPGDILFYKGHIENSAVGEYYVSDGNGNHKKHKTKEFPEGVGHNGLYIGGGKVIHAATYDYDEKTNKWKKKDEKDQNVHIVPVETFTKNLEYLGARRYARALDDYIAVTVPWWREDVKNEFDLYEEIARIYGYDKIPSKLPSQGDIRPVINEDYYQVNEVKKYLSNIGLSEIATYSFVTSEEAKYFHSKNEIKVVNPVVKGRDILRESLVPQMLSALSSNQFLKDRLMFFEVSRVFLAKGKGKLPAEPRLLTAGFVSRDNHPYQYEEGQNFYAAKGVLTAIFDRYGITNVTFEPCSKSPFEPGKSAQILRGDKHLGYIGEIDERARDAFDLKKLVAVFEINLDTIFSMAEEGKTFKEISRYPIVARDLSVIFPKEVSVQKARDELFSADEKIEVEVIDIYERTVIGKDGKSVTFRLYLQDFEKTMTDNEVEKIVAKCKNKIEKMGGKIRSGR